MSLWNMYVGCFTEDLWTHFARPDSDTSLPSQGIERFSFDDVDGSLRHVDTTGCGLSSPQYLALHPHRAVLYAAEFTSPGRLTSFAIQPDGRLTRQSGAATLGSMAVAVDVHPSGTFAYVGHLGDGALSACRLGHDGAIDAALSVRTGSASCGGDEPSAIFAYKGSGAKQHQVRVTPRGDRVLVADVGGDEVTAYAVESSGTLSSEPVARAAFPEGSAPRHLEFHPSGRIVYVVGEGDAKLYVLEAVDHVPQRIISTHPVAPPRPRGSGRPLPSELHLHPDGRTLFVGVRRSDCVTTFAVDENGEPSPLYHEPSGGRSPRAIRLDPSGRYLLVAHWESNDIVVFALDADRRLRRVGDPIDVPSPSSVVFAPASELAP